MRIHWRYQAHCWLLVCLLSGLVPIIANAADAVLMRVYLNHEDKGDWFFRLDGLTPLFTMDALRSMGLERLPEQVSVRIDGTEYVSLASMAPGITWRIDEQQSALYIEASPRYFRQQFHSRSYFNAPKGLVYKNDLSAYANYGVDLRGGDDPEKVTLTVPLETVFHAGSFSAFSNFRYTNSEQASQFVRLISAVTRDHRESQTRLTIGDFAATSGVDGGGGLYGGIGFSRNYSIDPYFNRYTGLSVYGEASTESQVEYYLDDRLLFTQQVSPGPFEFQDVRPPSGAHQARMVIKDTFGNTRVVSGDFYFASRLLKPGVHEFSYNAGFERENFGQRSADYGEPVALGFHRAGITEWLTVGGRFELSSAVSNIGGSASVLLSRLGEMDASVSSSSSAFGYGYAATVDYRYTTTLLSVSARIRTLGRDYYNLSIKPGYDKTRYLYRAGLSLNARSLGNWSVYYSVRQRHSGLRTKRATVYFSKRIGRFASLVARYTRLSGSFEDDEFFLSLGRPLGRGRSGFINYRKRNRSSHLSARVSKSRPLGEGFAYTIQAGLQNNSADAELFGEYAGSVGVVSAGYRALNGKSQYRASLAGSVSSVGHGIHFSRPITDGFALVKVDTLGDVDVRLNNQFMGQTNRDGELLIPRLQSYLGNRISIDEKDIPINYEFAGFDQVVATPYRGGATIAFEGRRLQAFTGQIYIDAQDERKPAEYWGLRYEAAGQLQETLVGQSGEFYVENLAPGSYSAEIFKGNTSCVFTLHIPESKNMYVHLGEIACEIPN